MKAVFLDAGTLIPNNRLNTGNLPTELEQQHWDIDTEALTCSCDDIRYFHRTSESQLIDRAQDAQIIISNKVKLNAGHFDKLPQLKLICVAATGVNNIDTTAAQNASIAVTNVAGYSSHSVTQICFTLILNLTSRFQQLQQSMQAFGWENHYQFSLLPNAFNELRDKTLGIIGYGDIGRSVAQVAEGFGMKIIKAQLPGRPKAADRLPMAQFLPQCDIVSLHCPQTDETFGLVDDSFLAQMKSSAILINTARGGLVDEAALAQALTKQQIAGAGLDVLSSEPPAKDNPLLQPLPNLLITPHIGWASKEARQRLVNELASNITAFRKQQRRNRIV